MQSLAEFNKVAINKAVELCKKFHAGQNDRMGAPYWIHPYRVAINASRNFSQHESTVETFLIGLFHDVVEDCYKQNPMVLNKLYDFLKTVELQISPKKVMFQILLLTHPKILDFISQSDWVMLDLPEGYQAVLDDLIADEIKSPFKYNEWIKQLNFIAQETRIYDFLRVKLEDNFDNSQTWRQSNLFERNRKYDETKIMIEQCLERNEKGVRYAFGCK